MALAKLIGKILGVLVITAIAAFWTGFVVLSIFVTSIRKGFRRVFSWKDRTKYPPPLAYKAWDHETRSSGNDTAKPWNHAYVTVPESGMRFHFVYTGKVPEDLAISNVDGETVRIPEDTESSRPKLLLCLHGFPENWFSWRYILRYFDNPDLELEDYFVVAIDCRGYGDSDKPKNYKSYHINNLVCDVKGIGKALGYDKFVLAGHDWGGAIAWNVASIYPEILEKMIILNCPDLKSLMKIMRRKPGQFLKSWYMFFFQIPYLPEFLMCSGDYHMIYNMFNGKDSGIKESEYRMTADEIEVFKYSLRSSVSGPLNYYRAMLWPMAQPGPKLLYPRKIKTTKEYHTVPILVIWGSKDNALDIACPHAMKEAINPNNGSKVIIIDGASHWVQQDAPRETIEHMAEFLKQKELLLSATE